MKFVAQVSWPAVAFGSQPSEIPQVGGGGRVLRQRRRRALEIVDDDRAQRRAVGAVEKARLRGLRHELVGGPGGIAEQVVDDGVVFSPRQSAQRRGFQVWPAAIQGERGYAPGSARGDHRASAGSLRRPSSARIPPGAVPDLSGATRPSQTASGPARILRGARLQERPRAIGLMVTPRRSGPRNASTPPQTPAKVVSNPYCRPPLVFLRKCAPSS